MRKVAEFYKRMFVKFPNFMAPFPDRGRVSFSTKQGMKIEFKR